MKKMVSALLVICMLSVTVMAYAGETEETYYPDYQQAASAYLDQDTTAVKVTVDLGEGWSAEFAAGAVYLYNGKIDESKEVEAYGITLDEETFNEYLKNAPEQESYKEYAHCFSYTGENGEVNYFYSLDGRAYFLICVTDAEDAESVSSRFSVELAEKKIIGYEE